MNRESLPDLVTNIFRPTCFNGGVIIHIRYDRRCTLVTEKGSIVEFFFVCHI